MLHEPLRLLYLFWCVLNISLGVGLLYLTLRLLGLLRQRQGLGIAVLVCLGLLAMCRREPADQKSPAPAAQVAFGSAAALSTAHFYEVSLDSQSLYHLGLLVSNDRPVGTAGDTTGRSVARISPVFSGWTAGQRWRWLPGTYQLNGLQLRYDVAVELDWNLLGVPVYTEFRKYCGVAVLLRR